MHRLVLLRHGESGWNRENRFTGWTDVDLSPQGVDEARGAGRLLKAEGYAFDFAYTSMLKRAIRWRLKANQYFLMGGISCEDDQGRPQVVCGWCANYSCLRQSC